MRYSEAAFRARIQEEMPGVHFEIMREGATPVTHLRFQRRVEETTWAVSDLEAVQSDGVALEQSTLHAIESIRRAAIRDYGLQKEIDNQIEAAKRLVRRELRDLWLTWLEKQRPTRVFEGPDGEAVEVKMDLPYELQRVKALIEGSERSDASK